MNEEEYHKATKEITFLEAELWKTQQEYMDKHPDTYKEYFEAWCNYIEYQGGEKKYARIRELQTLLVNKAPLDLLEYDIIKDKTYGEYMSIEEFVEAVNSYCFIDSDGMGYLVYDSKEITGLDFYPSLIVDNEALDLSRFTGVMWYNK